MEEGPLKRVVVIGTADVGRMRYRILQCAAKAGYQPAEQQMLSKACFLVAFDPHTRHDVNAVSLALGMGRRVAVISSADPDAIDLACELYQDLGEFEEAMIAQALDERARKASPEVPA